ncbi:hypothetical protein GCM10025866_30870 [Naasia aerilata]|uniref:Uncharacterized protein n=1 Tax=Naasia aerilata TaxID=1162966 RepID=A0ABM8GFP8_9MICO|nr:hypothetical protein GCM10025866_30870 [Naasia aerilata]
MESTLAWLGPDSEPWIVRATPPLWDSRNTFISSAGPSIAANTMSAYLTYDHRCGLGATNIEPESSRTTSISWDFPTVAGTLEQMAVGLAATAWWATGTANAAAGAALAPIKTVAVTATAAVVVRRIPRIRAPTGISPFKYSLPT